MNDKISNAALSHATALVRALERKIAGAEAEAAALDASKEGRSVIAARLRKDAARWRATAAELEQAIALELFL